LEKLKKIPQFPLHIHWDGSIPADEVWNLSQKKGLKLKYPELDRERNKINYKDEQSQIINSKEKLKTFFMDLNTYHIIDVFSIPVGFMQTKEDLIEMAKAHCRYLKAHNIPYAETRFAPQYHTFEGLTMDKVIGYSLEGFEAGKEETGVDARLIISMGRESEPETTIKVVKTALNFQNQIVGIDLATEERGNPPEKHYEAFKLTFDTPIKRTVHAGEMCSEEENLKNIYTSITKLKANAVGHAIPLIKRYYDGNDLWQLMKENNVRLEANPISNHFLFDYAITYHNLDVLVNEGLLVTVNPDDPAMWPYGDMVYLLYFLGELYGNKFLETVTKNAVTASWGLDKFQKQNYIEKIEKAFKEL
ncbi:MAG: hypothetical protein M0Q02_13610, partial [Candidatus Muirbacterium halophilum]|nr:hypothetical protein [Candidatus Muirbacterium halophilum]